jgi:hypothetical protein
MQADRQSADIRQHTPVLPPLSCIREALTDGAIIRAVMFVRDSITVHGVSCLKDLLVMGEERAEAEAEAVSSADQIPLGDSSSIEGQIGVTPRQIGVTGTPVPPPTVSIVFMGDLNSTPETAVIEFFDK